MPVAPTAPRRARGPETCGTTAQGRRGRHAGRRAGKRQGRGARRRPRQFDRRARREGGFPRPPLQRRHCRGQHGRHCRGPGLMWLHPHRHQPGLLPVQQRTRPDPPPGQPGCAEREVSRQPLGHHARPGRTDGDEPGGLRAGQLLPADGRHGAVRPAIDDGRGAGGSRLQRPGVRPLQPGSHAAGLQGRVPVRAREGQPAAARHATSRSSRAA